MKLGEIIKTFEAWETELADLIDGGDEEGDDLPEEQYVEYKNKLDAIHTAKEALKKQRQPVRLSGKIACTHEGVDEFLEGLVGQILHAERTQGPLEDARVTAALSVGPYTNEFGRAGSALVVNYVIEAWTANIEATFD